MLPMPRMSIEDIESLRALLLLAMHGEIVFKKTVCAMIMTTLQGNAP